MKSVIVIARNTFREVIRDRILYGLIVFALLLLLLSLALGQLSFDESIRLSANFGFTGIHIAVVVLSIFVGSTLVSKEIEKQTILTLLARPISRAQFIIGKSIGLMTVLTVVGLGLSIILSGFLYFLNFGFSLVFVLAVFGILLEAFLLLALTLFFGVISRPMMTVVFTVSVFLLGHWVDSLHFFVQKSQSEAFRVAGNIITKIIPNLEIFNWRAAPVYGLEVTPSQVFSAIGTSIGWILILLSLAVVVFRRRDFV